MAHTHQLTNEQYNIFKQEFLQKQKINTQHIRTVIEKIHQSVLTPVYINLYIGSLKHFG